MEVPAGRNRARLLLALESSTSEGGVALLRDGMVLDSLRLAEGLRHGRDLMPAAADLLKRAGIGVGDLSAVAVSVGPGSYTGTRVGVMSAKALAYGIGCRLVPVSSLAVLAASLFLERPAWIGGLILTVRHARRDEVYAGLHRWEDGDAVPLAPDAALAPEEARERLDRRLAAGERVAAAGSGLSAYPEIFAGLGEAAWPEDRADPAALARLGWLRLLRDETADPLLLQPVYLRRDGSGGWTRDVLTAGAGSGGPGCEGEA